MPMALITQRLLVRRCKHPHRLPALA